MAVLETAGYATQKLWQKKSSSLRTCSKCSDKLDTAFSPLNDKKNARRAVLAHHLFCIHSTEPRTLALDPESTLQAMIGIFLPHPSLGSGSVDTCFQQPHPDNEDATYLLESCETGSTDTLVEGAIGNRPMQRPSKWTSLSNAFLQKWPSLHFTAPQIPSVHSKKAMTLLVDYTLQCIFYAAVFAAYAGASTFLGLVPLAFIPEEPYAGDANVIFLGALGGSILSVGFTTVHWGFYRLEELYEAAYGIYQEPSRRYRWQHETETNDPPPPELACRYGSTVFFHSVVAGLLTSGLLGPVVGTAILIQHGVMDGTLTLVQAMICGGVGTGVVFAILLIGVAVMHVTWDW